MLKELRDLVTYVLGFVDDVVELLATSRLPMSVSALLGKDRTAAVQLSGVILIIFISMLARTLNTVPPTIDLLAFSAAVVVYFALVSFLVAAVMRVLVANQSSSKPRDGNLDAYSYVLAFNLTALMIFVLGRELGIFLGGREIVVVINAASALLSAACASILFLRPISKKYATDQSAYLEIHHKFILSAILALTFLIYAAILVQ